MCLFHLPAVLGSQWQSQMDIEALLLQDRACGVGGGLVGTTWGVTHGMTHPFYPTDCLSTRDTLPLGCTA